VSWKDGVSSSVNIWQAAQSHGLRGADAAGLHDGVLAVHHVDVLGVVAAGTPTIPLSGMFVQVMEFFQPVCFS
jgi:hypothetical protein